MQFAETRWLAARSRVLGRRHRPARSAGVSAIFMVFVLCLAVAGCTGSNDGPAVYAGRDSSSALLIQWQDDGKGVLSGSVQIADKAAGLSGAEVNQSILAFTGKLDSDRITLQIQLEIGKIEDWTATLDNGKLRVSFPDGVGRDPVTLDQASAASFNADVSVMEAEVVKARKDAARAAAVAGDDAAEKAAEVVARREFDNAVSDLSVSREEVLAALNTPAELAALSADLSAARANLVKVKVAVKEAARHNRGFVACEFASQAEEAFGNVANDASFLEDDVRVTTDAVETLTEARHELLLAATNLQSLSEHSGQSPKSGSTAVQSLIDRAGTTAIEWRSASDRAAQEMASLVSQAQRLSDKANAASC